MSSPIWYNALLAILKPIYRWKIKKRAENQEQYELEIRQRFGDFLPVKNENALWIHAVSVGETNAIQPVVEHYLKLGQPILLTNTTKTGQARAKSLFAKYDDLFQAVFLPVDEKATVQRFLEHYQPKLLALVETELWSNLLHLARRKQIPALLLNARLSEKSAKSYAKVSSFTRAMLQQLNQIIAQDEETKHRFIALGASEENISVVGNIKFDMQIPEHFVQQAEQLKEQWSLEHRKIMLLASTHANEEYDILSHLQQHLQQNPELLCIVVPRHPERFDEVKQICDRLELCTHRRSLSELIQANTQVYLADTMGEMWLWYALAQSCFVGGSLNETGGGHNILEPMLLNVPTMIGYKYFNFQTIVDEFVAHKAIKVVHSAEQAVEELLKDIQAYVETQQQIDHAMQLLNKNKGSLAKHIQFIDEYLSGKALS